MTKVGINFKVVTLIGAIWLIAILLIVFAGQFIKRSPINDSYEWHQSKLGGNRHADPVVTSQSGVAFAANDKGTIYRSTDNGRSWTKVATIKGETYIFAMCVTPKGTVLVGTGTNVLRSQDNGNHWNTVPIGKGYKNLSCIGCIACDLHGRLYAGTDEGLIVQSIDDGKTWRKISTLPKCDAESIAINSKGYIFVAAEYNGEDKNTPGIYRSIDSGRHWKKLSGSQDAYYEAKLVIDQQDHIYITNERKYIWASADNGENWDTIQIHPKSSLTYDGIAVNPRGEILVGTLDGLYISSNGGKTWTPCNLTVRGSRRLRPPMVSNVSCSPTGLVVIGTSIDGVICGVPRSLRYK